MAAPKFERDSLRIRFALGNALRFAGALGADLARSVVGVKPVTSTLADAIIRAPNAGGRISRSPAPRASEIQVAVGPPDATLSLEILDPPEPRGTVFVLHGVRDSREAMRGWGRMLVQAGYRAALVDLRGHGRSTGHALTYGVRESRDLAQALDSLDTRGQRSGAVGVLGFSYGAAVAIQWAGLDQRVRAVVAVAPFASLREVVTGYLPVRLPAKLETRIVDLAGERAAFDPDAASPKAAVARTDAPILLIHGTRDARIPFVHSQQIYAARRGHAEIVLVEGAKHRGVVTHPAAALALRAPAWFNVHLGS